MFASKGACFRCHTPRSVPVMAHRGAGSGLKRKGALGPLAATGGMPAAKRGAVGGRSGGVIAQGRGGGGSGHEEVVRGSMGWGEGGTNERRAGEKRQGAALSSAEEQRRLKREARWAT